MSFTRNIFRAAARIKELETKLDEARKLTRISCLDWAEDHTYIENLALKLGVPESKVKGDSYGVPGITDLVDMIVEHHTGKKVDHE